MVVTTEAWTGDNDLITLTFKVERNRIEELFATHYDRRVATGRAVVRHSA